MQEIPTAQRRRPVPSSPSCASKQVTAKTYSERRTLLLCQFRSSRLVETPRPPSPTADSGAWITLFVQKRHCSKYRVVPWRRPSEHIARIESLHFSVIPVRPVRRYAAILLDSDVEQQHTCVGPWGLAGCFKALLRMQHGVPPVGGLAPSVASR